MTKKLQKQKTYEEMYPNAFKLDAHEQEIADSIDWDNIKPTPKKELAKIQKMFKNASYIGPAKKDKSITFRTTSHDLQMLKQKALSEGMRYQTMLSSVLHKYVTGQLVPKI